MTLRKITIHNSVRYIPKNEQTKSKKQSDKIQPISGGGKQNKKFSKNNKKFVKDFTASGFGILTKYYLIQL